MKFSSFMKDQSLLIVIYLVSYIIILLMLLAFKVPFSLVIAISIVILLLGFLLLLIPFYRKKSFYDSLIANLERLDKKYLILETLTKPEFYEGELLYQSLYEINKSMGENVNRIAEQWLDFKNYIEIWIHEVKIPLATLVLMSNNHQDKFDKKAKTQLKRLEGYVDQILYYARSENTEKDYLIKETNLSKVIKNVGLKNMDDLLENQINYNVLHADVNVLTDSKWLEFILGQIVNNSIKYKRNIKDSYIKISVLDEIDKTTLIIEDNGIGIKASDIKQVFNKSFTGENGRVRSKSTGMGLFIAKNMCEKLGHKIAIESEYNQYTRVSITFGKNKYYEVVK